MRDDIGKESVKLEIDYSLNHYAWLKYSGFQSLIEKPYFGHGVGMFKNALEELIKTKKINSGLQDYKSAQSQYFTLASEIESLAFLLFFILLHQVYLK